jgi:hypothetical protein
VLFIFVGIGKFCLEILIPIRFLFFDFKFYMDIVKRISVKVVFGYFHSPAQTEKKILLSEPCWIVTYHVALTQTQPVVDPEGQSQSA